MATKIFYNDNRIIIDGHADNAEECQAITAMCDEMANSENFKTIVYEKGHAVFEQISGGDSEMFAAIEAQLAALKEAVRQGFLNQGNEITALKERVTALENKASKTLPYTADELIAKLESI